MEEVKFTFNGHVHCDALFDTPKVCNIFGGDLNVFAKMIQLLLAIEASQDRAFQWRYQTLLKEGGFSVVGVGSDGSRLHFLVTSEQGSVSVEYSPN